MGASNLTPNIHLPLFVDDDKPSWLGDINEAMTRIDSDSGAQTAEINTLTTQLNVANAALITANATIATLTTGLAAANARITALAAATGHVGI